MLITNPSPMDDSHAPPPYTPSSPISEQAPNFPIGTGLRGGDAHLPSRPDAVHFHSAAAYLQERPCTIQYPSYILNHTLLFPPNATRDDLPFPQPQDQYQSRDVSMEDWDTFVNYLLPTDVDSAGGKGRLGRPRSKDTLRDREVVEAVLAEWHEGFFGPRGIQIDARFPTTSHLETSPPPPFTSTANVGVYPDAGPSTNERAPMPSQPPLPYGQSPLQWARNNLAGTRLGSGPLGRLLSGNRDQQPGVQDDFRSRRERHRHDMRERRNRSVSSSSTSSSSSSSSSDSGHGAQGGHHRRVHHGGRHHGRGRRRHGHGEHHHRLHRSSSSSSSSSESSVGSMSSSDFSGADANEVRRSFVALRQNLNNKAYLSSAVRQFKNEIRESRRQHHDVSRNMRNMGKDQHRQLKAQRKGMKAELKSLVKEARAMRKADRKVRKAERKSQRAHRRAERRGMDANAISQKAVAKAEAKALKALRKAVKANEAANEKAVEAEERARVHGGRSWDTSRGVEAEDLTRERDLAERTRSLDLNEKTGQETGVCAPNE